MTTLLWTKNRFGNQGYTWDGAHKMSLQDFCFAFYREIQKDESASATIAGLLHLLLVVHTFCDLQTHGQIT